MTMKFSDKRMIRMGMAGVLIGILIVFLPLSEYISLVGFVMIGLGCAPIYPCIIHSTPALFGADKSQAIIGVQMASAYLGSLLMPPVFGLIANHVNVALLPVCLLMILVLMAVMYEKLVRKKLS
jgi:fucose permease